MLFAGCNKTDSEGEHPPENQPKSASISIVISSLGMTFPAGMDENDNPYLNYIEERTGLEIGVNLPPPEVYNEKLDVIMSSGNLPDMLHTYEPVWFDNYVKQKAFMPLDELIDKHGPHLKRNSAGGLGSGSIWR